MMSIAESFRRFRRSQGLSQQAMADKLGIKQGSYTVYENRGGAPTVKTLIKMAQKFNISTDYLLGLIDEPRPLNAVVEVQTKSAETSNLDMEMAAREWRVFKAEILEMAAEGKPIDVRKAVHNAEYFAEIERRTENVEKGINVKTFTDEEWAKISNA